MYQQTPFIPLKVYLIHTLPSYISYLCHSTSNLVIYSTHTDRIDPNFDDHNHDVIRQVHQVYPTASSMEMETFTLLHLSACSKLKIHASSAAIVVSISVQLFTLFLLCVYSFFGVCSVIDYLVVQSFIFCYFGRRYIREFGAYWMQSCSKCNSRISILSCIYLLLKITKKWNDSYCLK